MLDIKYNSDKLVGYSTFEERSIIKSSVISLHEAIKKAATLVQDIYYNEINGGWRVRIENSMVTNIEMFFYDNLSSGAGYSSIIGNNLKEVLAKAREILMLCDCDRSCRNCLDNYYNQRSHAFFDRKIAIDLLDYAELSVYPKDLDENEQKEKLLSIEKLAKSDGLKLNPEMKVVVIPTLRKKVDNLENTVYLNKYDLSDWLPNTFVKLKDKFIIEQEK